MHSAHRLKEGTAFLDDHRVDVVPVTEARWELEIVGRLRGEGGDGAHNSCEQHGQPNVPVDPRPPSSISGSIVGADAHPDAAHGASPVISRVGIVWLVTLVLAGDDHFRRPSYATSRCHSRSVLQAMAPAIAR